MTGRLRVYIHAVNRKQSKADRAIAVLSIEDRFLHRLLVGGLSGRVHSAFERVVNIEADDGDLLTLACRSVDDAPDTAILDLQTFPQVPPGTAVWGQATRLRVGSSMRVDLADARHWTAPVLRFPESIAGLCVRLQAGRAMLAVTPGGFSAAREREGHFESRSRELLRQRASALTNALMKRDLGCALAEAKSLIGLGSGLTPSGDDYLLGLFAVLNIRGSPCEGWLRGGKDVLAECSSATHRISQAALTHAASARVRESISSLLQSMLHGGADGVHSALRRVLAIGSTSGADIACGVVDGLHVQVHIATRFCLCREAAAGVSRAVD